MTRREAALRGVFGVGSGGAARERAGERDRERASQRERDTESGGSVAPRSGARPRERGTPRAPTHGWTSARWSGLVLPAILLVLWELVGRLDLVPANWLPSPSEIAKTLLGLARGGELWGHVATTLARVAVGFAIGAVAGTVLGAVTGHDRRAQRLLDPTVVALGAIPSMAWAPLFLLWLGIHESSKTALIALGAFFPVYLNLSSGIRAIDPKLVEVGRVFRLSGLSLARRVLVPAALPAYLTGLRSGLGLAWMFVVAAEILGASRGVGYLMIDGENTSRADLVIAAIILFAALGKATDALLERAGRRFTRWRDA